MFLLKRREDGKFWRNRASGSYCHWRAEGYDAEWTDDISDCQPFRTISGAKNNRGVDLKRPFEAPTAAGWRDKVIADAYHKATGHWYSKANIKARNAQFDLQYEIVPVRIRLEVTK